MDEGTFRYDLAAARRAIRNGDWDRGEALCRSALARENDPRFHALLGLLAAKSGQLVGADMAMEIAFRGLAPSEGIREGLTSPLCDLADPDLACRILYRLREKFGDHPCLRPRSGRTGHWSAAVLAGLPPTAPYWPAMSEHQVRAVSAALGIGGSPQRVLEWGSGNSSLYFSAKLGPEAAWDSIEHDPAWQGFVSGSPRPAGGAALTLHAVPADAPLAHPHDDGDLGSFGRYVRYPATLGSRYGFILVDGRARIACLRAGWPLLREDGVLALHDSEREEYLPGLPDTPYRIALRNRKVAGAQIGLDFFMKSAGTHAALAAALRQCLPAYVDVSEGRVADASAGEHVEQLAAEGRSRHRARGVVHR